MYEYKLYDGVEWHHLYRGATPLAPSEARALAEGMYVIRTNLQFRPDGSLECDSNRTDSAIFALTKRLGDAYAFAEYVDSLWVKKVRTWNPKCDAWSKLSDKENLVRPIVCSVSGDDIGGWPKNFGLLTGLLIQKLEDKWQIEKGPIEISAIFRRYDDARAIADFLDRQFTKSIDEEAFSYEKEAMDNIRPLIVKFIEIPEWAREVDE